MSIRTFHEIPVEADRIVATLFSPQGLEPLSRSPVVICTHGLTGSRIGACYRFVRLAAQLAKQGVACLTFDFRGCGESDGQFIDVTCDRLQCDLRAVIDWVAVRKNLDASRVGICGSSFGAFTTAQTARHVTGLKALVFWAPVASPGNLFDRAMNADAWALLQEQGWLEHRGMPLGRAFFDLETAADDGPATLANVAKPLLIFHARADAEVPFEHALSYETALKAVDAEVRLESVDTPDHGMRSIEANDRLINESAAWFRSHL